MLLRNPFSPWILWEIGIKKKKKKKKKNRNFKRLDLKIWGGHTTPGAAPSGSPGLKS